MKKLLYLVLALVLLAALTGCAQSDPVEVNFEEVTPPTETGATDTTGIEEEADQLIDETEDVDLGDVI